jgi:Mn2+/Fe2+ NRAMP family transporter
MADEQRGPAESRAGPVQQASPAGAPGHSAAEEAAARILRPARIGPKRFPWRVAGRGVPRLPRVRVRDVLQRPGWFLYLSLLGPGLIAANAGNDAGGIATYSSVGASFGYSLLWALALITVSLIVVQEMVARMGVVTGKGLSDLIRENLGVRWTAFAMLALFVANASTVTSEFAGIAAAGELFGIPKYISVPLMAAAVWWLVVKGSYRRVERIFLLMTLAFFAYPASAFLARPDWGEVLHGFVRPQIRLDTQYLYMFVALVGTTITPYMQVFQQTSVVEKGLRVAEYRYVRLDTITGSLLSNLVAAFIIIATAATLHRQGIEVEDAASAARALAPLAGEYASVLFGIGLFGASMLAASVLPLATAYSISEAFGWEHSLTREWREAPAFYSLFTLLILGGAAITLIPGLPLFRVLVLVQVINGVLLPVLLFIILHLVNDPELMGEHVNSPLYNLLAWGTALFVAILSVLTVITTVIVPLLRQS